MICYFSIFVLIAAPALAINPVYVSNAQTISTRLTPGQDIMTQLAQISKQLRLTAVSIISAVGSVIECSLRFANQSYLTPIKGPLEIVSLSGTIDEHQKPHIHISLSDSKGATRGGHLPSLDQRNGSEHPCRVFTTLQLVLAKHSDLRYIRKIDNFTTFDELTIEYSRSLGALSLHGTEV